MPSQGALFNGIDTIMPTSGKQILSPEDDKCRLGPQTLWLVLLDALAVLFIHSTEAESLILKSMNILYLCYEEEEIRIGNAVWEVLALPGCRHGKERLCWRLCCPLICRERR